MLLQKRLEKKVNRMKNKTIKVDYLARVEGEGSLLVKIKNDKVSEVEFKIFEPPRFFEAFLRGRHFTEVPDITARICGICPVAYQMSSIHALENILQVKVDPQIRELRRLLYCGEWIESHVLHIYMLHAPDFLGYEDAIQLAGVSPEVVKKGLQLKKAGNDIVNLLGGREIHPINVRVGGFYKIPSRQEFSKLAEKLKHAQDIAIETVKLTSTFQFPKFEQDYEFVALKHPKEYPFNEGRLVSNKGLNINVNEYENYFHEEHVRHSNALQSAKNNDGIYFVGPLARYNLNFDKLPDSIKELAKEVNMLPPCNNPFKSITVRAIETLYACKEALRIIEQFEMPEKPFAEIQPREGTGYGCTEAPRGILYHKYRMDANGIIQEAKIVPPTSQNQKQIENDLFSFVSKNINLPTDELTWKCEQTVRNYDPCISCATHFLKLNFVRE